jgi:thioredoxin 1
MILDVNRENYETEILQSKGSILVDFWGPKCGPCLALMPVVEKLDQEFGGKVKVAKVNAAENRMLCAKLRVMALPTFLLYRGGVEKRRLTGDHITEQDLLAAIHDLIK